MSEFRTTVGSNRRKGKWARSCYYRNPRGWITVDQYMGTALQAFSDRGFQRLAKYGDVTRYLDQDRQEPDPGGNWGPILRHPDGPGEFPAEQVIIARWYKKDFCPVPEAKFPQLKGIKIQEYQCPQCNRPPFISAEDAEGKPVVKSNGIAALGVHLQVAHSWDRLVLLAYGERVGIDFNVAGDRIHSVVEYKFEEEKAEEAQEEPDFEVETVTAEDLPVCECGWAVPAGKKSPEQSLRLHQRLHCPLRNRETVRA